MTNTPAQAKMSTALLNTMALVGFILSLCGLISGITAIPGVVLSHIGLSQIKRTGESGRGFALAGIIVGYCIIGLSVLAGILAILILALPLILLGSLSSTNFALGY
jgi:hypothetical protein